MMSWSQKIFIEINRLIGRKPPLDSVMRFLAVWAVYVLIGALLVWSFFAIFSHTRWGWFEYLGTSLLAFLVGLIVSSLLGVIHPAKRPKDALPGSVELIRLRPFEYWKSFPSDHTMTAFTVVFVAMSFELPVVWSLFFLLCALAIACSRVYVGVHFPRDIFGGLILAAGATIVGRILMVSLVHVLNAPS